MKSLSKLRRSLAQRGLTGTLRAALHRNQQPAEEPSKSQVQPQPQPQPHPFDQRYGVDTSGLIGGGELRSGHQHDIFNTAYYGMAPSRFRPVMDRWLSDDTHPAIANYSFIDLGCGKGRAVLMASEYGFRQVIGVELHRSLAKTAEKNLVQWAASGTGCLSDPHPMSGRRRLCVSRRRLSPLPVSSLHGPSAHPGHPAHRSRFRQSPQTIGRHLLQPRGRRTSGESRRLSTPLDRHYRHVRGGCGRRLGRFARRPLQHLSMGRTYLIDWLLSS